MHKYSQKVSKIIHNNNTGLHILHTENTFLTANKT